jgi:hypothetical protein
MVVIYTSDGGTFGPYYNWGHIYQALPVDLDGDGHTELVLAGTNNAPAYQGATVILLDAQHFHGASVDSLLRPECPLQDSSLVRLVMPQYEPEFMKLLGTMRIEARDVTVLHENGKSTLRVSVGNGRTDMMVYLDAQLRPLKTEASDALKTAANDWPAPLSKEFFSAAYQQAWLARCYRYGTLVRTNVNALPPPQVAAAVIGHQP